MIAFLLCGGAGTRLRPVTDRPKAILDVAGWPFLRYHIETLGELPDGIVFLTGHGGEDVERVFRDPDSPSMPRRVFVQEPTPLGTGGALANARSLAGDLNWVANGDSYVEVDPAVVIAAHRSIAGGNATIVTVRLDDASDYGSIEIDGEGRITGFLEKGRAGPGIVNAGIYLIDRALIESLPEGASSLERDAFPRWAREGRLRAHPGGPFFLDIGVPERLAAAQSEFRRIRERLEARR